MPSRYRVRQIPGLVGVLTLVTVGVFLVLFGYAGVTSTSNDPADPNGQRGVTSTRLNRLRNTAATGMEHPLNRET